MSTNLSTVAPAKFDWNPKVAGAIALLLVFLCGAVVGALAMDFGIHNRQRGYAFETLHGKAATLQRLQKDLDLTPAQSEQVESTLNDFWQYYRTVLTDCKQRLEQSLTAEQKVKFERLLQEPKK
jgi:replication initiation and membrane attachment protein DnaB